MPTITAVEQPKSTTITRTTGTTAFKAPAPAQAIPQNTPNTVQDAPGATPGVTDTQPKAPTQDERLALLARKERALQAQIKELKALQAAKPEADKLTKPIFDKASFLKNPEAHGVSREELEQVLLGQMAQSPEAELIRQLQAQVQELKSTQESTKKTFEETQTKAYQQAVKQIETEVNTLVDTSDAYEVIKADGRQSAVVKLIERTYKEDGILLDAETAAAQVEEELLARALKLASVSKVKAKLLPSQPPAQSAPLESAQQTTAAQAVPQQTPPPTLSTAMAQQTAKRSYSAAERLARAKLIAQGKNPDAA